MRAFHTYESYAAWRKSTGGAATEPVKLVGFGAETWAVTYDTRDELTRLAAQRDQLSEQYTTACRIIEKMATERDQALDRAAAAAMEMRDRVLKHVAGDGCEDEGCPHYGTKHSHPDSLEPDHDAQKALDKLLTKERIAAAGDGYRLGFNEAIRCGRAEPQPVLDQKLEKAREDAIREAAAMCVPRKAKMKWGNRFTPSTKNPQSAAAQAARKQCHDAILALLNDGGGDEN